MRNTMLKLLITIVDRDKGKLVVDLLKQDEVLLHYIMLGNGTAHKDLLGLLGLRDTAKDVIFSFIGSAHAKRALRRLSHALDIDQPGRGVAFALPLGSIGMRSLSYMTGMEQQPAPAEEGSEMVDVTHELIIAVVNRGFTDAVMEAARPAGARGGTVVHARGAGSQEAAQFLGITIQPEKEMVMILVEQALKLPVMQAITKGVGLQTEGRGIVFSLPVTEVMGMVRANPEISDGDEP